MRQNVRGGTKEEGERGGGEERRRTKEGERARGGERAGAGTNSAKHTRDTRVGRLPKHPKLFVRTCSRDLAKAQTLLLIRSDANEPRWPVIFHFASFPLSSSFFVIVFSNFQFLRIGIFIIQIEILFKISFNCFERNNNGKME